MNSSQKNSVRRSLIALNETLHDLESLSRSGKIEEIVYCWRNPLSPGQWDHVWDHIRQIRGILQWLGKEHDLQQVEEDILRPIREKIKMHHIQLEEIKSYSLKRLGDVDPALQDNWDPHLVRLKILLNKVGEALGE